MKHLNAVDSVDGTTRASLMAYLGQRRGFTLIELLIVLAIMVTMMLLVAPSMTSLKSRSDFTTALYKIEGKIEEGRTYAMANNTHVFVGITEVDASQSASVSPQIAASEGSGGRIAIMAFASRDGTSVYDVYALHNWVSNYGNGNALMPVGKLCTLENLHLVAFGTPPASGAMARPTASSDYNVARFDCVAVTPVTYPAGSQLTAGYKYYFSKVIDFSPQGIARIISTTNGDAVPNVIEIGLQPTHRNVIPPVPSNQNAGSHAVIQIDGATGASKIYQP